MTLNLNEMLALGTKTSKDQLPTWKNLKRNKKKRAKAATAPKRKRRKRTVKAREAAKAKKVLEAPHRMDLSGNPIIPYAQKPKNPMCLRCKKECKQTAEIILVCCPAYTPIKPRKNAKAVEEVA